MKTISMIALGCLSGAELLAPAAVRIGERLNRFSTWIEERRTRLAILSVIAD